MQIVLFLTVLISFLGGVEVKIASYNVENLFDMNYDGNEYEEYIPNGDWGWTQEMYRSKLRNSAQVIREVNADIIALQEIESEIALKALKAELNRQGLYYRYHLFARNKNSTVNCALLSRYPILSGFRHPVSYNGHYRDILEGKIEINGQILRVFVNHWKSKSGSESQRILSAKRLAIRLSELPDDEPYVLLGDFNSHYEEYKTFLKSRKHNDTEGITGINHILKTIDDDENPITYTSLKNNDGHLYNLWYEVEEKQRWSHQYRGKGEALDNMVISPSLADGKGLEYVRGSFQRFEADFLFYKGKPYRWQQTKRYPKTHIGEGYSDHLPITAVFRIQ
ncbi:endonuclease/exonuclease/phosphatase family protein [Sulfuricurvum sp.]|uniref:endonuclease/exonuclease/phosphatase family protein n=1 Tax=Sulfuricurvum sp. TaxID=2025608 RepID=UPI003BB5049C